MVLFAPGPAGDHDRAIHLGAQIGAIAEVLHPLEFGGEAVRRFLCLTGKGIGPHAEHHGAALLPHRAHQALGQHEGVGADIAGAPKRQRDLTPGLYKGNPDLRLR